MGELFIRPAVVADIPVLADLIQDSVRQLNAPDYSSQQIESALRYVYGVDTQLIDDGSLFVAEIGAQVVGCGGWSRRKTLYGGNQLKDAADPLLDPLIDPARIRAFFVHPAYARRGIGRQLMDQSELCARKAGFQRLELMATLTGRNLYTVCGFHTVEEITLTLPDSVMLPVVRMEKVLAA